MTTLNQLIEAEMKIYGAQGKLLGCEDALQAVVSSNTLSDERKGELVDDIEERIERAKQHLADCRTAWSALAKQEITG